MVAIDVLLHGFAKGLESLNRTLPNLTEEGLIREPHPPIGWIAWRLTRVMGSRIMSQLIG